MNCLQGKTVLITGGSSGIGRAASLAFAKEGARVAIVDCQEEGGEESLLMVKGLGAEAIFIPADVTQPGQVENMVKQTVARLGSLDCAFNNAGLGPGRSKMADLTEEEWDRVMAVNLKGVWLCMKYEIARMLEQGRGSIVNTASIIGLVGFQGAPAYVASKHGVVGLTKAAALEYAGAGIRVNAVCPGVVRTPMTDSIVAARPKMADFYKSLHPMGRLAEPEEIAEAAVWLCGEAASFVTGHTLVVDGGVVAG